MKRRWSIGAVSTVFAYLWEMFWSLTLLCFFVSDEERYGRNLLGNLLIFLFNGSELAERQVYYVCTSGIFLKSRAACTVVSEKKQRPSPLVIGVLMYFNTAQSYHGQAITGHAQWKAQHSPLRSSERDLIVPNLLWYKKTYYQLVHSINDETECCCSYVRNII